jgi:hypothetical protein
MNYVAMIGAKGSYKCWAVEFQGLSAVLEWQKSHSDYEVQSWAPVVHLEDALRYADKELHHPATD